MTRLFFRVYASIALLLALAGLLTAVLLQPPSRDEPLPKGIALIVRAPTLVSSRLMVALTPEARARTLVALSEDLGTEVHLVPVALAHDALTGLDADRLKRGEAVVHAWQGGPPAVLVPVPDQPLVAVVQPAQRSIAPRQALPVLMVGFLLLGTALVAYLSLRPLQQQLERLRQAARSLGSGDLSVRAEVRDDQPTAELSKAFNDMAQRIERLLQGRQELMLAVSHELRTPIARLRFAVDMLAAARSQPDRDERADAIQGDLEELERIIGELLRYTSLEEGQRPAHTQRIVLETFLQDQVARARELGPSTEVILDLGPLPTTIDADERLLQRALGNLMSNAVRYTDHRVQLGARQDGDMLEITVDDDGMGVPSPERARIFEPMVRLDEARSRDTGGVGLGLALARRIARAHGGDVTCELSPMKGARFRLTLPLQRQATGAEGSAGYEPPLPEAP